MPTTTPLRPSPFTTNRSPCLNPNLWQASSEMSTVKVGPNRGVTSSTCVNSGVSILNWLMLLGNNYKSNFTVRQSCMTAISDSIDYFICYLL